jgi:hypothetical protein
MASKLLDYLTKLTEDPDARSAHKEDPDAAMSASELSEEEKEAVKSSDPATIKKQLGDDAPPGCMIVLF